MALLSEKTLPSVSLGYSETREIPPVQVVVSRGKTFTPEKPKKSRSRKQGVEGRAKVKSRTRRNLGHSYLDSRGRQREARVLGPSCQCKKNCRQLLQGTEPSIFNSFLDLNTYDQQNTYLFSTLKVIPKKRSYKKKTKRQESARKVTNPYFVKANVVDVQICKTEFLSVHGLQNSSKRLKFLARQISEGRTTPKRDGRGKHQNRPNRTSAERVQSVHDHIQAIPKHVSHYSRKVNPSRVFLKHGLNISTLYKDYYVEWCKERAIAPVKEDRYRRIFCSEYNIGFKLPKSDTCHTCDLLNNQMEANKENQDGYNKLRIQLQLHQTRAVVMQESLSKEVLDNAKNYTKDIISFDLQQTLPTPSLTVGPAFYLRSAWTYNLGIHDGVSGKALNVKKIQDLKKFLKYIPPVSQQFFVDIVGDTIAAESDYEQTEGEEGVENIYGDEEAADIE
ncbi:unnamed protein product [Acanthoscelides obtectus]|uniref:Uncharacterized protein n=1 Tax=Acanthoscelides obtectus TaxID=200917 RepID=A0A9P0KTQ0_ACAOB|nr:unnamed protein product [Acanthoscelides obtectus]CAK1657210.1 hypothetical protein AOBTE_LOCUS20208 [Acanthoscelides obtectus]